ncbi:hypothetical protein ABB37_06458 [Leptomonas pyrrhocoris]|uniref:Transmembrane protein n=1 Tax=Leptomonas pyrrhocoris TaxID=157538 RepID=A0A0N1J4N7_LEPPY|nr:hypothetical protein ABB37_06458 [Leptomonas pyrrhocoris]XP_015656764.1 hypothetical protein ABB37_06458 [Leptomonas pyrrhocoris]KPA78324.1 hypothetical protein ABB37_06458 [Leptomonas pyrrhocoris]KPA78325.1 hypothetical protein ABB37_06458 [Leptomonas pyrrhocoris]|eukprot:XP_015656763.1 hypothetical protein ABB37_06458 [Leptomonas pyrrhocoris]
MKRWALAAKAREEDKSNESAANAMAEGKPEKPVVVKVPPRPLLDVAITLERFNPNFCVTTCSIVIIAMVMGSCFVVLGIPPLFLDDWKGKRIYVGIMVPLLTLLCTVLLYYVMQQPQRTFNTALMRMVRDMEHHSNYLSTAVDHVERELNARGVNIGAMANSSSFGGRPRGNLATPDESSLQQPQPQQQRAQQTGGGAGTSPQTATLHSRGSFGAATGGSDFLRGIDSLEESHDMVIATVHVGKEWKWFKDVLGQLKDTTLGGPTFPSLAYQRVMVRMLSTAIARVEKLILSLYFSSFLLHRVNAIAPLNLWGASAASVGTADWNRGDMHSRAEAALMKSAMAHPSGNNVSTPHRRQLRLPGDAGESPTESTFTLGNMHLRDSEAADLESPVFSAAGALDVRHDEETHTELTPPSQQKGFTLGSNVMLPQFTPLIGSGEMTPTGKPQRQGGSPTTAVAPATTKDAAGKREAPMAVGAAAPAAFDSKNSRHSDSTMAAAPFQLSTTKADVAANHVAPSDHHPPRSASDEDILVDVDVEGESVPLARMRRSRQAATKGGDGNNVKGGGLLAPRPAVSAQQPQRPHHVDATPNKQHPQQQQQLAAFDLADSPFPLGSPSASPPPVKPPLPPSPSSQHPPPPQVTGRHHTRQPGSAVVPNPSLTLHRGARFVHDEDTFFITILVHVRKARLTCFSRLYAAQAHVKDDGKERKHYFSKTDDAGGGRKGGGGGGSSSGGPFTLFHISDVAGEREGLTLQEQRLLSVAYCRPENHPERGSDGRRQPTDLSSLAVKDRQGSGGSLPGTEETPSPPNGLSERHVTSVYAEEVDSFIVALTLLADRPMRLTFLPTHIETVAHKDQSSTVSSSLTSLSPKAARGAASNQRHGATAAAGAINPEQDGLIPPLRTVPVLECVIDDVLCVLTRVEVMVDSAFETPSRILLVGVSLEDVSEGSERGVGDDDLDSLEETHRTRKPAQSSPDNSPNDRHGSSMATSRTQTLEGLTPGTTAAGYVHTCTVGQEFHEVITVEADSVSEEPSPPSP